MTRNNMIVGERIARPDETGVAEQLRVARGRARAGAGQNPVIDLPRQNEEQRRVAFDVGAVFDFDRRANEKQRVAPFPTEVVFRQTGNRIRR